MTHLKTDSEGPNLLWIKTSFLGEQVQEYYLMIITKKAVPDTRK